MSSTPPLIALSACLGVRACRYNNKKLSSPIPPGLDPYLQYQDFCPEEAALLGTPRQPIQSSWQKTRVLTQQAAPTNLFPLLQKTSLRLLQEFTKVDGVLLKGKSPSCGLFDHPMIDHNQPQGVRFSSGVMAQAVLSSPFALIPVSDTQLSEPWGLQLWLAGVFQLAALKAKKNQPQEFALLHRQCKPLLQGLGGFDILNNQLNQSETYIHQFSLLFWGGYPQTHFIANLSRCRPEVTVQLNPTLSLKALLQLYQPDFITDSFPFPESETFTKPFHQT